MTVDTGTEPGYFAILAYYVTEDGLQRVCLTRSETETDTAESQCARMVKLLQSLGFKVVEDERA